MLKIPDAVFQSKWTKSASDLVFIVLFFIVCIGFNYQEIIFKRPQSVHVWRQADCASMALNYHQHDLPLLKPQLHFRFNDNAEAMGEYPILYYAVGALYDVFGYHEFIYRLLWLAFAFLGSFCLYRLSLDILQLSLESVLIGLMLLLSPVVAYYSISFISDPVALFLVPVAFLFLYSYLKSKNSASLICGVLILALSGLLKLSALIIPLIALGSYVLFSLSKYRWKIALIGMIGVSLIILLNYIWYRYVFQFNEERGTNYFFTKLAPFWQLESSSRKEVLDVILDFRLQEFYNKIMLLISAVLIGVSIIKNRISWISFFLVSSLLGFIIFFLLFFQQFRYHDYYMINLVIMVPMVFIIFFKSVENPIIQPTMIKILRLLFIFLILRNTVVAANFNKRRYMNPENSRYENEGYFTLEKKLDSLGVEKDAFVISVPDDSPNVTLYLMNRSGWTNSHFPLKPENIEDFKARGAEYLIIGEGQLLLENDLRPYFKNKIGEHKSIHIFKL